MLFGIRIMTMASIVQRMVAARVRKEATRDVTVVALFSLPEFQQRRTK
jgi:hypothetical protein